MLLTLNVIFKFKLIQKDDLLYHYPLYDYEDFIFQLDQHFILDFFFFYITKWDNQ